LVAQAQQAAIPVIAVLGGAADAGPSIMQMRLLDAGLRDAGLDSKHAIIPHQIVLRRCRANPSFRAIMSAAYCRSNRSTHGIEAQSFVEADSGGLLMRVGRVRIARTG
jgi:hypothetical protein